VAVEHGVLAQVEVLRRAVPVEAPDLGVGGQEQWVECVLAREAV
jgi:hypothetical protein